MTTSATATASALDHIDLLDLDRCARDGAPPPLERYDAIDLAGPVSRVRSNFLHGIKHLPATLRPA